MEQNVNLNKTRKAYRNATSGLINNIASILLPFALRTVLIMVLGEEYLGLSTLFRSMMQVLNLADIGLGSAIVYNMYKPLAEDDTDTVCALLNLYRKIYTVIGLTILTLGLCLIPFLDRFIKGEYPANINLTALYLLYLCDTVFSYLFIAHRVSLLDALQQSYIRERVHFIMNLWLSILKLVLLLVFKNYYLFVAFTPILSICSRCVSAYISCKRFPQYLCRGKVSPEQKRSIVKRVSGLLIQRFGNTISSSLDSIVISSLLGLSVLAVYSNYYFIMYSVMTIVNVCIRATTAGLGNSIATNGVKKNYSLFQKLNLLNQWCIAWCVPCLMCLYQPFLRLWVGEALTAPISLAICLSTSFYVSQTRSVVSVFRDATGLWWADKWKPLVGCIVNLTLNLICVQLIGVEGVVLSTIFSYAFVEIPWETRVLFKTYFHQKARGYYLDMLKYAATTLTATLLAYSLCSLLPGNGILNLALRAVIAFAVSNGLFVLVWHKQRESKEVVNMVKTLLCRKNKS